MPPGPKLPPTQQLLTDLLNAIQSLELTVAGQADDLVKMSNFQRYMAESFYGANTDIEGIWNGTDRYIP